MRSVALLLALSCAPANAQVEPDLVGLTDHLARALKPFQVKYFRDLAEADGQTAPRANFLSLRRVTAPNVWGAFRQAMEEALDNRSLNLRTQLGPPRQDGSIFISVSSYRDETCRNTVMSAFERADKPELVNVGIVQQNCQSAHGCYWGSGWGDTREWAKRDGKDPDCVQEFCASEMGKPHCDAGRVRILRLGEHQAYGPLFSRFLNAKLYRGENYFMQIDAHTNFRQGWDSTGIEMMKKTPSFPYSVLSTYPAQGMAASEYAWPRPESLKNGRIDGLCGATFEFVEDKPTIRLERSSISSEAAREHGVPPRSCFVAAGFFLTHGSYVDKVPADPFMPFIFMGEEMELSLRMWTNGFDIYAPPVDIVRHEYERHASPKFWETVNMVFSAPSMHNDISALILQRVGNLIDFPEDHNPKQMSPSDVITHMDEFGVGKNRTRKAFLQLTGLDVVNKVQTPPRWCTRGTTPPEM